MVWPFSRVCFVVTLALTVAAIGCFDVARASAVPEQKAAQTLPPPPPSPSPLAEDGEGSDSGDESSPTVDLGSQPVLLLDRVAKSVRAVAPYSPFSLHSPISSRVAGAQAARRTAIVTYLISHSDDRLDAWKPSRGADRFYQPHAPPIVRS